MTLIPLTEAKCLESAQTMATLGSKVFHLLVIKAGFYLLCCFHKYLFLKHNIKIPFCKHLCFFGCIFDFNSKVVLY